MNAILVALTLTSLATTVAFAHPLAPALLEITETAPGAISLRWKTSLWKEDGAQREPRLPADCTVASEPRTTVDATSVTRSWEARCASATLVGATFGVKHVGAAMSDTIVRAQLADGRTYQAVLRGANDTFVVPARQPRAAVMREYAALGIEHILSGFDHLLFVFGLVLLVPPGRRLLWTVSAFTVGHSVTLSLAILGYTRFPTALIEVCIAASVLALAVELARPRLSDCRRASFMRRYPWIMAGGFGLLHGFGFAGALQEAGLPPGEIPTALLAFNLGIEAGQLIFIAIVLLAEWMTRPLLQAWPSTAARVPVYAMGSLAAFWLFERASALLA